MRGMHRMYVLLLAVAASGCASSASTPQMGMPAPSADVELRQAMRKLWADHVVWTRGYIVAAVAGHADAQSAANRLMKNQEDIGNAIVPYYGAAAGAKLTTLLKDHITIAVDVVGAAKANDSAKLSDANRRWHDNAADIATFLSGANPHWKKDALQSMLNEHLALTTQEATARLQGRWDDDRATFDKIFDQAMMMADALTDGILKHHPMRM